MIRSLPQSCTDYYEEIMDEASRLNKVYGRPNPTPERLHKVAIAICEDRGDLCKFMAGYVTTKAT